MLEVLHEELAILKSIEGIPNYIHGWDVWVGLTHHQTNIPLDNIAFVGDLNLPAGRQGIPVPDLSGQAYFKVEPSLEHLK